MSVETDVDRGEKRGSFGETARIVVHALILAVIVRFLFFQPFNIPSGSMKPTLLVGDYLFVSKYSYGYSKYSIPFSPDLFSGRILEGKPEAGDVAVFRLPTNTNIDYIKRVIGVPGDRVQMRDGVLYLNDQRIEKEPLDDFVDDDRRDGFGNAPKLRRYRETLPNGVSYTVLDTRRSSADNTIEFLVPEGHYFMMGDNRDNSADSRSQRDVGFVPLENFIGRAEVLFFSADRDFRIYAPWTWPSSVRFSRFFNSVE
ncbi:MAG: signal peptidase I [Pseudomonadota bacterium]